MRLTLTPAPWLEAQGEDARSLHGRAYALARSALGRMARRIVHAAVSLREHERPGRRRLEACKLRLRVAGARDIVVECIRPDRDAAIEGAFKQARRALLARGRLGRARGPRPPAEAPAAAAVAGVMAA